MGKEFKILGYIKGIGSSKVLLGNKPNGYSMTFKEKYYDSCISRNDSFFFNGQVKDPDFYSIEVEGYKGWSTFILTDTVIKIIGSKDSIYKAKIEGGIEQKAYMDYIRRIYTPLKRQYIAFYNKADSVKQKGDSIRQMQYIDSAELYLKQISLRTVIYLRDNPDRFVSLVELSNNISQLDVDTAKYYYSLLSEKLKNHERGRILRYKLFDLPNNIQVGKIIPDFSLIDSLGGHISFSTFSGKYILLDFWASWCLPCIKEFPDIERLYEKYDRKFFEVIGISLDVDKKSLVNALGKHSIIWPTFCDYMGDKGSIYTLFDIKAIPQKFFIGPDRKLLLNNPSMKDIEQFLQQINN